MVIEMGRVHNWKLDKGVGIEVEKVQNFIKENPED